MVKIRLRRTGAKKKPHYRVVVTPSTAPRNGRFIENIGHFHPRSEPPLLVIKEDRLFHWLSVGAQPSDSMARILTSQGIMERFEQFKAGELVLEVEESEEGESVAEADVEPVAAEEAPITEVEAAVEVSESA